MKKLFDNSKKSNSKTVPVTVKAKEENKTIKVIRTAPDTETANGYISDYNNCLREIKEFNPIPALLDKILRFDQYQLKDFLYSVLKGYGYNVIYKNGYLYAKGEIPIMLCAHMDTVHEKNVENIFISDNGTLWSPQGIGGDDRCGIYTILMSITGENKPYILFTEDEETGCIGAGYFADDVKSGLINGKDININFIVEADRKGADDSVYYDCDNPEFEEHINSFGFVTSYGTCSDISYIAPALGVAAVNLSCGYYDQHTLKETIVLSELYNTIHKVRNIIADAAAPENASRKFEYVECKHYYKGYYSDCYDNYYQWKYGIAKSKYSAWETDDELDYDGYDPDTELPYKLVSPIHFETGAYILTEKDCIYESDSGEIYYIDENNKVYMTSADSFEDYLFITPISGIAYTAQFSPYRFNDDECVMAYIT